jgi:drug/metabolite transporter (DMT)-like permease
MNNLRGVLYAVVSSATFGLIPLFSIPLLQGGMSSPAILFYRFGLAAAMMGLIALATRRPLRITWPQTGTLLLLGAMYSVTALGLLRSYTYIPSSVATTINFLYPLGVAIVMTLFFREKNSVWLLVAILISLVGVALLSWGDIGGPQSDRAIVGVGFAGATVLTYTIYIVGVKKSRISRLDPMIQAFYVLLFSACFFLVYALSTTGAPLPGKWHLWQNLLLLALVPTVVSNLTLVLALILTTGGFTYFQNAKQVSRYLGICPTYEQSGTSVNIRGHINRNGDAYTRGLLYIAAWPASRFNAQCKETYTRLRQNGKPGKLAMIAVANKLVRQAFAVVAHDKEYIDGFVSNRP